MLRPALLAGLLTLAAAPVTALTQDLADWRAALAAGEVEDFETARLAGRGVESPRLRLAPLSPREVAPGEPAGGALFLGRGEGPGLSGRTVSTRDLAWPYGFVIDFARPVAALEMSWAVANADWQATAFAASGAGIGETVIAGFDPARSPVTGGTGARFDQLSVALAPGERASGGIARLELQSLHGYDWLHLDALRFAQAPRAAHPALVVEADAEPGSGLQGPSPVPLPVPLALLAAGLAALPALRKRG